MNTKLKSMKKNSIYLQWKCNESIQSIHYFSVIVSKNAILLSSLKNRHLEFTRVLLWFPVVLFPVILLSRELLDINTCILTIYNTIVSPVINLRYLSYSYAIFISWNEFWNHTWLIWFFILIFFWGEGTINNLINESLK